MIRVTFSNLWRQSSGWVGGWVGGSQQGSGRNVSSSTRPGTDDPMIPANVRAGNNPCRALSHRLLSTLHLPDCY